MKLVFIFLILLPNTLMANQSKCSAYMGAADLMQNISNKSVPVIFGGLDMVFTGSKVTIESIEDFQGITQRLVFRNVQVFVVGLTNFLGFTPGHYLRTSNTSTMSELCSQITGGRFPFFHSDYNNITSNGIMPTRIVTIGSTDHGPYAEATFDNRGTNLFSDLICSEVKNTY